MILLNNISEIEDVVNTMNQGKSPEDVRKWNLRQHICPSDSRVVVSSSRVSTPDPLQQAQQRWKNTLSSTHPYDWWASIRQLLVEINCAKIF
mmetsp:Transcript_5185/g.16569  ORF Transcript_5185/g.16569 Transcript_5185/m.16569 type:complete len:92 (-) Transcript_5185:364-639(-)